MSRFPAFTCKQLVSARYSPKSQDGAGTNQVKSSNKVAVSLMWLLVFKSVVKCDVASLPWNQMKQACFISMDIELLVGGLDMCI